MRILQGQFMPSDRVEAAWGQNRIVKLANPAAGKNWETTVPGGQVWRVATAIFTLKTSAQVANRIAGILVVAGDGTTLANINGTGATAASLSTVETFARDSPATGVIAGTAEQVGLPNLVLEEGWSLRSSIIALQTEDQIEAVTLWVEEFEMAYDHTIEQAVEDLRKAEALEEAFAHG